MSVSAGADPMVAASPEPDAARIQTWCRDLASATRKLNWKVNPCEQGITWKIGGWSVEKRPLLYTEFGDPRIHNTTLILASVHGDEVTPVYLGAQLVLWLKTHPDEVAHTHVIVAPLVNPDGFYHHPRHRTNGHKVDVNRNFPTNDWKARALQLWKVKFRSNPRRFPGPQAESEPETIFQEELIKHFQPQKILSIHSPLNVMDYDGPTQVSLAQFPSDYVATCLTLRKRLRATSTGFFPGSLGNYAGEEMGIPTITLELPTADPRKAETYWQQFSKGIQVMIQFVVPAVTVRIGPPAVPTARTRKVAGE